MSDEVVCTIHDARCVNRTDNAIKVQSPRYSGWVPQSAVHDDSEVYSDGHKGKLVLKKWFAKKKGLELD